MISVLLFNENSRKSVECETFGLKRKKEDFSRRLISSQKSGWFLLFSFFPLFLYFFFRYGYLQLILCSKFHFINCCVDFHATSVHLSFFHVSLVLCQNGHVYMFVKNHTHFQRNADFNCCDRYAGTVAFCFQMNSGPSMPTLNETISPCSFHALYFQKRTKCVKLAIQTSFVDFRWI